MAVGVHHIEIWVGDLDSARESWGWLLPELGWSVDQERDQGTSWRCGEVYLVITRPPALSGDIHDRRLPGINHVALHGGPDHFAAYLENEAGFKVEVVGAF
jgi:catechol 2,3-dioxygenase-like lactoylglutathione lyase family enzyme